jgi:hypothetical protein
MLWATRVWLQSNHTLVGSGQISTRSQSLTKTLVVHLVDARADRTRRRPSTSGQA